MYMVTLELVENEEKYYEFIRLLRIHPENISGFIEQFSITPEQQLAYMQKYKANYYIALENNVPVGWVGVIDDDIRVCTDPEYKGKGVGKFMINEVMKLHPTAFAKVLLDNEASKNLFISCGFKQFSEDKNFIYYRNYGV